MHLATRGVAMADGAESDDELFAAAAHALSVRGELNALLEEALSSPGLAMSAVKRISNLYTSGELDRAERAWQELRRSQ